MAALSRPEKAGTYIITAYQNYSDTSKRTKLASHDHYGKAQAVGAVCNLG